MKHSSWLAYVINLDRSQDRLEKIQSQLKKSGLPFKRVSGVDGALCTPDELNLLNSSAYEKMHGKYPLLGELGCYLSHVKAMREFLNSQYKYAVILEDDVNIAHDFKEMVNNLIDIHEQWDMVKLSGVHRGTPLKVSHISNKYALSVLMTKCTGSSAYIINRVAAENYLQFIIPMQLPYDHEFDKGWKYDLKIRAITPFPIKHDNEVTSVIGTAENRKFKWHRRIYAYRYRLGNEFSRLIYAISSFIKYHV